jgi:hypothetical protein
MASIRRFTPIVDIALALISGTSLVAVALAFAHAAGIGHWADGASIIALEVLLLPCAGLAIRARRRPAYGA